MTAVSMLLVFPVVQCSQHCIVLPHYSYKSWRKSTAAKRTY